MGPGLCRLSTCLDVDGDAHPAPVEGAFPSTRERSEAEGRDISISCGRDIVGFQQQPSWRALCCHRLSEAEPRRVV